MKNTVLGILKISNFVKSHGLNKHLPTSLKLMGMTRWGSFYFSVDAIIRSWDAIIDIATEKEELENLIIPLEDDNGLDRIKRLHEFLDQFLSHLRLLEGDLKPTCHLVLPILFSLKKYLKTQEDYVHIRDLKRRANILLHERIITNEKERYWVHYWKEIYGVCDGDDDGPFSHNTTPVLTIRKRKAATSDLSPPKKPKFSPDLFSSESDSDSDDDDNDINDYELIKIKVIREFEDFKKSKISKEEKRKLQENLSSFDILDFWSKHAINYPILLQEKSEN
eukprot:Pgem_evm1s10006